MSITKNFLKTRASCKVRFHLSAEEASGAKGAFLVGDFNDWNTVSHLGLDCQFRYLTDGGRWINDSAADAYVPCAFAGAENSLVKV